MGTQILPLFPLSIVLLPGMQIPLHIFEDRYRELMAEVIPTESEFGVVFAKDDGIVSIGCTAVVNRVIRRYSDGRLDLVANGQRRFKIQSLDEEKSYLRAEVEFFDDENVSEVPSELLEKANVAYKELLKLEQAEAEPQGKPGNLMRMSFQLAQFIADLDKRQTVLSLRSETERLQFLVKIVPEYIAKQSQIALAKRVGPLNGHAKHVTP